MTIRRKNVLTWLLLPLWLSMTVHAFQSIAPPLRLGVVSHTNLQQKSCSTRFPASSTCLRVARGEDPPESNNNEESIARQQRRLTQIVKYPFRKVRAFYRLFKRDVANAWADPASLLPELPDPSTLIPDVKPLQDSLQQLNLNIFGSSSSSESDTSASTLSAAAASSTQVLEPPVDTVQPVTTAAPTTSTTATDRSAVAAANIDLTGHWKLVVTEDFKAEYDKYLTLLGQPFLVRSVALGIIGLTTEETIQTNQGRNLEIKGRNVRGVWDRTLVASEDATMTTSIVTADGEPVEAEAWWEEQGTVHRSWLRGVKKYGGGAFESKRYLQDNGNTYVCESTFHPDDVAREKARVTWRFHREQSS
jgi:hypothetical protein